MSLLHNHILGLEELLKCDFYDGLNRAKLIAGLINTEPGIDVSKINDSDMITINHDVFQIVTTVPMYSGVVKVYHYDDGIPSVSIFNQSIITTEPLDERRAKELTYIYYVLFIGSYINTELSDLYGKNITFGDEFMFKLRAYFDQHVK